MRKTSTNQSLASVSLSSSSCWTGLPRPTLAVSSRSCSNSFNRIYFPLVFVSFPLRHHIFISLRSKWPACHILTPFHLGLPPSAAAPRERSGHKYENWNSMQDIFLATIWKLWSGQKTGLFNFSKATVSHSNIFARIYHQLKRAPGTTKPEI